LYPRQFSQRTRESYEKMHRQAENLQIEQQAAEAGDAELYRSGKGLLLR
jgi:hypothetical protein